MQYQFKNRPISKPFGGATVRNAAGGHGFAIDPMVALRRWLIAGSVSNTFYEDAEDLTDYGLELVRYAAKDNPTKLYQLILESARTAVKYNTALLALAQLSRTPGEVPRSSVVELSGDVIKTASMLYEYLGYYKALGKGWGSKRNIVHGVIAEFLGMPAKVLEYQFVKYRQREGFSARDVLRIAKPSASDRAGKESLYAWVTGHGERNMGDIPQAAAFDKILYSIDMADETLAGIIAEHRLTRDMVPASVVPGKKSWEELYKNMPAGATLRNLGQLTAQGVFKYGWALDVLESKLGALRYTHPVEYVKSAAAYMQSGLVERKGGVTWKTDHNVVRRLSSAYETLYQLGVKPLAVSVAHFVDISGSMQSGLSPLPPVTQAMIAAVNSTRRDKRSTVIGFHGSVSDVSHVMNYGLKDLVDLGEDRSIDWGGTTNAGAPLEMLIANRAKFDVIVYWTDLQSWQGHHPWELVQKYRQMVNNAVKVIYVALVPSCDGATLADPDDPLQYTIGGFSGNMAKVLDMIIDGGIE